MRHDPLRKFSAHPQAEAADRDRQEAALERYLVRESPLRDFVAAKLQQAPWWTISLLVHIIALLILWRWPVGGPDEAVVRPKQFQVDFVPERQRRPPPKQEKPKPDKPVIPKDSDLNSLPTASLTRHTSQF